MVEEHKNETSQIEKIEDRIVLDDRCDDDAIDPLATDHIFDYRKAILVVQVG